MLQRDLSGICQVLKETNASSIPKMLVFVQTKNIACKLYGILSLNASKKTFVGMYHASLTSSTRERVRTDFLGCTDLCCLVATVAFGMVSICS